MAIQPDRLRHSDDAEDAMQEALVQTFRHVSRLRDPRAFRPWLYRTVRNACLPSRRRRVDQPRRMVSLEALLPAPGTGDRSRCLPWGKVPRTW
jgi:DNA-directed RNA polymerase specialized sigma24 family protein